MKVLAQLALYGALSVAQIGASAWLQPGATSGSGEKIVAVKAFRTSKLVGMKVKNDVSEDLGKINELVLDVEAGKVMYVALSVGGVLGVGDKLIAIPWTEFQLKHEEDDTYFVLDIDKEKLEAAPGFDEDDWPDVADQAWRDQVDRYYQKVNEAVPNPARRGPQ
jgi:sporulation protein YlmC with PRC-barrel domain